jgi:hypothetical protein
MRKLYEQFGVRASRDFGDERVATFAGESSFDVARA